MPEIIEPYYVSMLKGHGFTPDPDDHQYGALGLCWKLSPEIGEGSYWTYGQKDLYDIKIHNFSFHEDSLLEFSLPECLSITRYDSISGEELAPYRRLSAGCIKTYIGGYEPYQVLIHKNIPIHSIGIEIMPAYYEDYLKKQYPEEYRNPVEAFRKIDQTTDFPEMSRLLSELQNHRGDGIAAKLFYESKVAEALSLVVEYQKKRPAAPSKLSQSDLERIQTVAAYLSDHYAAEIPMERLTQIACMGTTKLKSSFKKVYDCTITEYLHLQPLCGIVPKKHRAITGGVSESRTPVMKHQKGTGGASLTNGGIQFLSFISIFRVLSEVDYNEVFTASQGRDINSDLYSGRSLRRQPGDSPGAALPQELSVVGDDQHAQPPFCEFSEQAAHLQHVGVVQSAGGLIENQQFFSAEAAVYNCQPLLLPARERQGVCLDILSQIHSLQRGHGFHLIRVIPQPGFGQHAVGKELEVHILHDEKAQPFPVFPTGRFSVPEDRPGFLLHQAAEAAGQSGLPRPVVAGDGGDLSPGGGKGHLFPHSRPIIGGPQAPHR